MTTTKTTPSALIGKLLTKEEREEGFDLTISVQKLHFKEQDVGLQILYRDNVYLEKVFSDMKSCIEYLVKVFFDLERTPR